MRMRVDFPEPLAPMRPKTAPGSISNETSRTARTRRRGALRKGDHPPGVKLFDTPRTMSGGSGSSVNSDSDMNAVLTIGTRDRGRDAAALHAAAGIGGLRALRRRTG